MKKEGKKKEKKGRLEKEKRERNMEHNLIKDNARTLQLGAAENTLH